MFNGVPPPCHTFVFSRLPSRTAVYRVTRPPKSYIFQRRIFPPTTWVTQAGCMLLLLCHQHGGG